MSKDCCKYEFKTDVPPKMSNKIYMSYFTNTLVDIGFTYADKIKESPMWWLSATCLLNLAKDLKKCNLGSEQILIGLSNKKRKKHGAKKQK
ncbi:hypothetical protein LCGC14_1569780 [marine sediment metagenome]|uniref:Uncharacterized protein n=1 Tax=marine sediment metagenome TaxID=412755 RepID=A0A0F9IJY3_9ZZZZ|nr:hypothetical protein [bacterium]